MRTENLIRVDGVMESPKAAPPSWSASASRSRSRPDAGRSSLVSKDALRDLRVRGDIIKTMHRAMTGAGHEPNVSSFALHGDDAADPMLGRLVARGRGSKDVGRLARINNSPTLYQSGLRCLSPVFAS